MKYEAVLITQVTDSILTAVCFDTSGKRSYPQYIEIRYGETCTQSYIRASRPASWSTFNDIDKALETIEIELAELPNLHFFEINHFDNYTGKVIKL